MKKILLVLLALLTFILLFFDTTTVYAKSYDIEKADFIVDIQENGDIEITEKWTVDYNGQYSRFFKSTPPENLNDLECYDYINIENVNINGKECVLTHDTEARKAYTYSFKNGEIAWYYPLDSETVTYEVTYNIRGLVKESDNNKAIACWRFVSEGFDTPIEDINIYYKLDDIKNIDFEHMNRSNWTQHYYDEYLLVSNKDNMESSQGMLQVAVSINLDFFTTDLGHINNISYEEEEGDSAFFTILLFSIGIIAVVMFLIKLDNSSSNRYGGGGGGSSSSSSSSTSCYSCSSCSSCSSCGGCGGAD